MIYLLLIILVATPLAAMEPVSLSMNDKATKETMPLLAPQRVAMNDQENADESKSILFNGSRRYYDHASYKKVRNEAIKRCACDSLCSGLGMGCLVCAGADAFAGCLYACAGSSKGLIFKWAGSLFVECGVFCGGATCLSITSITGCGLACDTHTKIANNPEKLEWNDELKISSDMLAAADPKKMIWLERESLKNLVERASKKSINNDCALPFLRKLFTCSYCTEKKIRNVITKRLQFKAIIPALLADKFKKKLGVKGAYDLPKDVIKHIFTFIDFTEINKQSYVTEKELFYLLRDLTKNQYPYFVQMHPVAFAYAKQLLLAQNGWLSLTKSEQYPIRCEMKYFDITALPQNAKRWYCPAEGPTIYLPFDPQLARYYQFEKDPAYQAEHNHPSNSQITALLAERKKHAPQ